MAKQKKRKTPGFPAICENSTGADRTGVSRTGILFFWRLCKKISDLKSDAYDKVHSATDETFRSSQTSLVYDTNGTLISVLKGEKDMYYLEYEGDTVGCLLGNYQYRG